MADWQSLMTGSDLECNLVLHMRAEQLPMPEKEYRFDQRRKWRFDFAWPEQRVACEVEGGTWANGRHTRGSGFERDCQKYNAAALAGWRVLRFTGGMVERGEAVATLARALA
jgi:very-short-patch-repair endonuclease